MVKEEEQSVRAEVAPNSPLAYRPVTEVTGPNDAPLVVTGSSLTEKFWAVAPPSFCDVYIEKCQSRTLYLCGAVPAVFLSYCKDTLVFVGAARVVHLEYCVNCRVIVAARLVHIDSSIRCTAFLLANARPLVTGNCPDLVIAPYNALYRKFGLDLLAIGINPVLNLWDSPVLLGSLGSLHPVKMPPSEFMLQVVPFAWGELEPIINPPVPDEYGEQLQLKRNQVMNLKRYLSIIRERRPELYGRIIEQIRERGDRWMQERGQLQEIRWLEGLEQAGAR
jgi:hypothetical protein